MTNINKPNTYMIRLAVYLSLLIFSYFAVAAVSDIYIRDKAHKFCHAIAHGDLASSVVAFAEQAEEKLTIRRDTLDSVVIEFVGLPPFNGYTCSMITKNDHIVTKTFAELP